MGSRHASEPAPATIYDVAAKAGVSITTVSYALNKPGRVAARTLERVHAVIDELGYTPKAAAVSQARKSLGRIGVLAPFTSYESYRTRLIGVLEASAGEQVEVVVHDHESAAEATSPLLSALPATGRLDGLLLMGVPLQDEMAERLAQRRLPVVLVDSSHRSLPSVNVDDERGGYLAGEYLVGRGHRTFAYVSERQQSLQFVSPFQRRLDGFRKALADAGIAQDALQHVITSHDVAGGRRAAVELVERGPLPDAVLGHFDDIAAGLLAGFRSRGVHAPDDVAVMGYDDGPLAEALDITTVRQPLAETGRQGAALLLETIANPERGARQVLLPTELVSRASA